MTAYESFSPHDLDTFSYELERGNNITVTNHTVFLQNREGPEQSFPVVVELQVIGDLSSSKPVLFIDPALTGNAQALAKKGKEAGQGAGWAKNFIGPGKTFDTDHYTIVSISYNGGAVGSTGHRKEDITFQNTLPVNTNISDLVSWYLDAFETLEDADLRKIQAVVGFSVGGAFSAETTAQLYHRLKDETGWRGVQDVFLEGTAIPTIFAKATGEKVYALLNTVFRNYETSIDRSALVTGIEQIRDNIQELFSVSVDEYEAGERDGDYLEKNSGYALAVGVVDQHLKEVSERAWENLEELKTEFLKVVREFGFLLFCSQHFFEEKVKNGKSYIQESSLDQEKQQAKFHRSLARIDEASWKKLIGEEKSTPEISNSKHAFITRLGEQIDLTQLTDEQCQQIQEITDFSEIEKILPDLDRRILSSWMRHQGNTFPDRFTWEAIIFLANIRDTADIRNSEFSKNFARGVRDGKISLHFIRNQLDDFYTPESLEKKLQELRTWLSEEGVSASRLQDLVSYFEDPDSHDAAFKTGQNVPGTQNDPTMRDRVHEVLCVPEKKDAAIAA